MSPLCVIVRVYDRLEDLQECLRIIRAHWSLDLHLLVVGNGLSQGHALPGEAIAQADRVLQLETNAGHIRGNAQLLQAAVPLIPPECRFALLIEADTWLFSDRLLRKYMEIMEARQGAWASAGWQDRFHSVALDLALVRSSVLREHPELLEYHRHAECHVANCLLDHGLRWIPMRELMPVHIPRLMRRFWNRYGGRFRAFPEGPLVTHHHEDLPGGIRQKLAEANACLGREEYPVESGRDWARERRRLQRILRLAAWIPRSGHPGPRRRRRIEAAED